MAVTITEINAGPQAGAQAVRIYDVIATADADTTATIAHGMGVAPEDIQLTPLLQAVALLAGWAVTTKDATNVILTKATTAGSGNAGASVRVVVRRPTVLTRP